MITGRLIIKENNLPKISKAIKTGLRDSIRDGILDIQEIVIQSMQEPKTGRIYARPGGRMHQASAPGEAPAIDYGILVKSFNWHFPNDNTGYLFTDTPYAAGLEYGTSRVAPRPFMKPAADKYYPRLLDVVIRNIQAALR